MFGSSSGGTRVACPCPAVAGERRAVHRGVPPGGLALALVGPVHSGSVAVLLGVVTGLFLLGWGIGITWPHLLTSVLRLVPEEEQSLAGSSVTTIRLTATAFGSAVAGMLANTVGFSDGSGVGGTQSAARWLFAVFTPAPLAALVTSRHARR